MQSGLSVIPANFPFSLYDVCDSVAIFDPYVKKFIHTTVALGNPGHKLLIRAASESRAREAVSVCNELAGRCFPYAGGADGVVNSSLEQLARTGACCVEWVPDKAFSRIERAFVVPIKTLRWRYVDEQGTLQLMQERSGVLNPTDKGMWVPLQPVQTVYHGLMLRDSNPYAIPPILSALESCKMHRDIMRQIRTWVEKASSLGILLASVKAPPREGGESQEQYDAKAQKFLQDIAATLRENLVEGLGVGYDNIGFTFHNLQSGAQGAKEILQVALQGMFAALQRDPIWFGWNFGATETFARVIFQELLQGLKLYQQGPIKVLEHGFRLNLALNGMGDIGLSVRMRDDIMVDLFKEAEAQMMKSQAIAAQLEGGIIDKPEARKLLGYEDLDIESGAYVAALNKETNQYALQKAA